MTDNFEEEKRNFSFVGKEKSLKKAEFSIKLNKVSPVNSAVLIVL